MSNAVAASEQRKFFHFQCVDKGKPSDTYDYYFSCESAEAVLVEREASRVKSHKGTFEVEIANGNSEEQPSGVLRLRFEVRDAVWGERE